MPNMFRLITLLENTSCSENIEARHGLSFYIETPAHRLLFDMGPDDAFVKNAKKLGVDLSKVDIAVLSHGHNDHGGGLKAFLSLNPKANVYLRREAFEGHYSRVETGPVFIGLEQELLEESRLVFTPEILHLDGEITLFSRVTPPSPPTFSNSALMVKRGEEYLQDDFIHEQSLLLTLGEETVLLAGCCHAGAERILEKAEKILGKSPDYFVGGFHLCNPRKKTYESDEVIDGVARRLAARPCRYFTGHCTGEKAFLRMKDILGENLGYLAAGQGIHWE